jgi:anti-anti-sigma regulatory factor
MLVSFSIEHVSSYLKAGFKLLAGDEVFRAFELNLRSAAQQFIGLVVMDFSECIPIDSSAIASIVRFSRAVSDNGGKIKLRNMNENIAEFFEMVHLERFAEV